LYIKATEFVGLGKLLKIHPVSKIRYKFYADY